MNPEASEIEEGTVSGEQELMTDQQTSELTKPCVGSLHDPAALLLLDIGMPVIDGFAVIRRIRENPRLAQLPVVAVTAFAMRGDRERILNSGFDGYLSKPVNSSSLSEELERVLTKASQAAQARSGGRGHFRGSGNCTRFPFE
ncbi:MAG: response regulator [Candidatus Sulfotelmatobacter sp.]